jgi:hypothetical protein
MKRWLWLGVGGLIWTRKNIMRPMGMIAVRSMTLLGMGKKPALERLGPREILEWTLDSSEVLVTRCGLPVAAEIFR